ncbi:hypothetical protein HDF18_13320 [Mucilaginibacter sp. X5P1]|uniref:hypothetical protein n=1 Tax=Mucilaginibacter sp. X5P1 TaxID=2723088 RepID=UPI001620BE32|nr:hypothetical protein [Mucilaginibacter sp. X5P1]MBB6141678.1 hypothetical protein [Mucilaginibacter sp. X5P1]
MKLKDFAHLLKISVTEGAEKALFNNGDLMARCTKAEAYRHYGRSNVDRWVQEGLIQITNKNFDRIKLEQIAASSNRITYLPVADR